MNNLTKAAQEELDSFGTLSEKTAKLLIAENEKLSDELKSQVEERVFVCNGGEPYSDTPPTDLAM